jgi:hypothetical protein
MTQKEHMIMSIVLTVPAEAVCGLYAGVPESRIYAAAVKPENALPPTQVTTKDGITTYRYEGLEHGLYFCGVSQEGYNSLCQTIWYTGETQLNIELDKLVGGGYEAGYVMQYTVLKLKRQAAFFGKEVECTHNCRLNFLGRNALEFKYR